MTVRLHNRWAASLRAPRVARLAFGLLLSACSDEQLPPPVAGDETIDRETHEGDASNGETPSYATSSSGSDPEAGDAQTKPAPTCTVPLFEDEAEPEPFERLSATVVDEAGDPVSETIVQACGLNVCLQGNTTAQGRAVISGDEDIAKLAFKYGDGLHYAQVALLLSGETSYDLGEQRTVKFPAADPDNRFDAGTTLASSDVTLTLGDDTETVIDVLSYADPSEHLFVAKAFDQGAFPYAADGQDFVSVWALGPAKTEFCPPPELALPNLTELAPETGVDLLLLVTDITGRFGRYAEWEVVASGTVSEDGERIVTDAGRGIPELGLIGVRPQK